MILKDIIDAELEGRTRRYTWIKKPSQVTTLGTWFDLSMSGGSPGPKYWFDSTPGIAKLIAQSTSGGLFHGANVYPATKYIRTFMIMSPAGTFFPTTIKICDYLLYYPSIDESATGDIVLDNTTTISRYIDGKGVQILPVTVGTRTVRGTFYVTYTNSDGVSGRTSQIVTSNLESVGTAIGSSPIGDDFQNNKTNPYGSANPFIGLQNGDSGVRSIESVTIVNPADGLFSLLLVKPLCNTIMREVGSPVEKDFLLSQNELPIIQDDAFINILCGPSNTMAGATILGDMKVCWC